MKPLGLQRVLIQVSILCELHTRAVKTGQHPEACSAFRRDRHKDWLSTTAGPKSRELYRHYTLRRWISLRTADFLKNSIVAVLKTQSFLQGLPKSKFKQVQAAEVG